MIKKMQVKASTELDKRVHDDISRELAKCEKTGSTIAQPNIWKSIMRNRVKELTIAAAILFAFGIGFSIGRWSKPPQSPPSLNIIDYTSVVSMYPTAPKAEASFWRRKALAAMQPRPYVQSYFDKTSLFNTYKQYLKEKHYD
jgi:hypothetical protein